MIARSLFMSSTRNFARLARAKGYPYPRPNSSFLYISGAAHLFDDTTWTGIQHLGSLEITAQDGAQERAEEVFKKLRIGWSPDEPRTPVLAVGSNAGPEQLLRKYPPVLFPNGVLIPCVRCILPDFDVAYSPCITSYGSCSATLEYSPGTAVEIFVTFLTAPQLQRMHETEGAYFLTELRQVQLHLGLSLEAYRRGQVGAAQLSTVYQYNHQSGTLHLPLGDGAPTPVALKEIRAEGRRFPALGQVEMQHAVRDFLSKLEQLDPLSAPTNGVEAENGYAQATVPTTAGNSSYPAAVPIERTSVLCKSTEVTGVASGFETGSTKQGGAVNGAGVDCEDIDAWILQNLDDVNSRTLRVERLVQAAKPQQYTHVDVLMAIGDIYDKSVD